MRVWGVVVRMRCDRIPIGWVEPAKPNNANRFTNPTKSPVTCCHSMPIVSHCHVVMDESHVDGMDDVRFWGVGNVGLMGVLRVGERV